MPQRLIDMHSSATPELVTLANQVNQMFMELYTGAGAGPAWVRVGAGLYFPAFAAAALSKNLNLFQLAPGQIIHAVKIKHSEAFGGGAISACTISVGIAGSNAKYAAAFDVFQAISATAYQLSTTVGAESAAAATQITATATAVGANLNAATSGQVDIWALLSVTP